MDRTVKAHIDELQRLIQQLNDELMRQNSVLLRNEIESKVRAAETALHHYRTALELERRLATRG